MKKIYIIKVGTTFPATAKKFGDFDTWTINSLGQVNFEIAIVDAENGEALPAVADCAGVIVTGSHAMVTHELAWSTILENWLPSLVSAEIPILGVCYGHQLLAKAMGGTVDYHSVGKEIGTVNIQLLPSAKGDLLFETVPEIFHAHTSHSQSVLKLPVDALSLAENSHDPHHAFRFGKFAWGVQFHPEYDAGIMHSYISQQAEDLAEQGFDVSALLKEVVDTPMATRVLRNFVKIVES